MSCWIDKTYGMFDEDADESGRDERRWEFSSVPELLAHLRAQSLRFVDSVISLKEEYPDGDLATLGTEYRGVGFAVQLHRENGPTLSVGVAGDYWVILSDDPKMLPACNGGVEGRLVIYFHHWTEWLVSNAYTRETAHGIIWQWFNASVAA